MPLSWPYGVTRPVVGQMFHVKHSLWRRWCSGRRVVCCWAGLLGVPVGGGPPASRPRREPPARRVVSKPGQAPPPPTGTAARPSCALRSLRRPPHRRHLVCWRVARPGPATAHGHRGQAPPPPTGTATVPATECKKSAAPAGLRTCVELRWCRNSLSGGRPSPGAWRRRAR